MKAKMTSDLALSSSEKAHLLRVLGLDQIPVLYEEFLAGVLTRRYVYTGSTQLIVLPPTSSPSVFVGTAFSGIHIQMRATEVSERPADLAKHLFVALLPFPWSLLPVDPKNRPRISVLSQEWVDALCAFQTSLLQYFDKLSEREFVRWTLVRKELSVSLDFQFCKGHWFKVHLAPGTSGVSPFGWRADQEPETRLEIENLIRTPEELSALATVLENGPKLERRQTPESLGPSPTQSGDVTLMA